MILLIIMALWFTAYPVFVLRRYGKLTSISASTYNLMEEGTNTKWWFWAWLLGLGVLNMFQGMGEWGVWVSGALVFTGITTDHAGTFKAENWLHTISAFAAIILACAGLFFLYGVLFPTVVIGISALVLLGNKYYIWDMEMIAFYTIFFAYLTLI